MPLGAPPDNLDPALVTWPQARLLVRVHDSAFGATEFHPGPQGVTGLIHPTSRFAHFRPAPRRAWVPTLYAGEDDRAAFSETVLHTVPTPSADDIRPRRIVVRRWLAHAVSTLRAARDLTLVDLTPDGLERLGVDHQDLIKSPASRYPTTVLWALALHAAAPTADGMRWLSRQREDRLALLLWERRHDEEHRVARPELDVVEPPVAILSDEGTERLARAASDLDVTVVPPDPNQS